MLALAGSLGACNTASPLTTGSIPDRKPTMVVSDAERDCLGRAMYFESNRSDEGGLIAVGTVVMNRLEAAIFPGGICAVVGQPGQFAPGVLTKPMQERDLQKVAEAADAVLAGERHPKVGKAMYFPHRRPSLPLQEHALRRRGRRQRLLREARYPRRQEGDAGFRRAASGGLELCGGPGPAGAVAPCPAARPPPRRFVRT